MKDTSIFQGIKKLGELQFHDKGVTWHVFDESKGNVFVGAIRKQKMSNAKLYEYAREELL